MTIEIKVPTLPESVSDATVAKWYKKEGEFIQRDENLVDLETDKVMLEVPAPRSGIITKVLVSEGETVSAQQILALLKEGEKADAVTNKGDKVNKEEDETQSSEEEKSATSSAKTSFSATTPLQSGPSARRLMAEKGVAPDQIEGTGKRGRVTKADVEQHRGEAKQTTSEELVLADKKREEERVPMSRLRQRIAERLVQAQHQAAMLTTFNEVNMYQVMQLRKRYKDQFEKVHGVRLGFMSFFTKAVVEALKRFPAVNASVDGTDLIYHHYFDVGIAIGSPRGLVVPVLRNAELMSMGEIEKSIREYAERAKSGKITIEEMQGGTFTITNGGTFGSMLSTPIVNPPQSAILGMHNIVERPVVEEGNIVSRPMMYLALSYDHRVIDGRESVQFLVTIKELLEDPARLLLEV